jgi:hypothetical protein
MLQALKDMNSEGCMFERTLILALFMTRVAAPGAPPAPPAPGT